MGKITSDQLNAELWNNYRACYEGEDFEYHAVSLRQAWYLAFEHFGDECVDYLAEIDQDGSVVEVIMDKEDQY